MFYNVVRNVKGCFLLISIFSDDILTVKFMITNRSFKKHVLPTLLCQTVI